MADPFEAERFKLLARYFERSAARLLRLREIDAPQIVIDREVQIARNRLRDLDAALPPAPGVPGTDGGLRDE